MKCCFFMMKYNFINDMLISFKNIRKLFKYMMKYIKYVLFIFNPFYQENLQKFKEKKSLFQNFEMTSMEKDLLFIVINVV